MAVPAVADRFTLLNRGASQGTYKRGEIERDQVLHVMAGGETLEEIEEQIAAQSHQSKETQ